MYFSSKSLAYFLQWNTISTISQRVLPHTNASLKSSITTAEKFWSSLSSCGLQQFLEGRRAFYFGCLFCFVFKDLLCYCCSYCIIQPLERNKIGIKSSLIISKCCLCEGGTSVSIRIQLKFPNFTEYNHEFIHWVWGYMEVFTTPNFQVNIIHHSLWIANFLYMTYTFIYKKHYHEFQKNT